VVGESEGWHYIKFNRPSVLGWVSADFVSIEGQIAEVTANSLNMRQGPSLQSSVFLGLSKGYKSRIYQQRSGFVEVLAPQSYSVAILAENNHVSVDGLKVVSTPTVDADISANNVSNDADSESNTTSTQSNSFATVSTSVDNEALDSSIDNSLERLHIIAPGDAISLLVFGEEDLSIENVRVPQSGKVSLPLIGSVSVAGRTIPQLEEVIGDLLLEGYVKNPRLSVTMFSYRPIFIRGAVQETGSFPFSEGLSIGKAIALAGGSKKSAKKSGVSVLREGKVVYQDLSIDSSVEISSGDVITVDEELGVQDDDATYIYLHGEVASPGEYEFRRGLTVEKAIVLAGGFTLRSSRRKISITRYLGKEDGEEPERLKKVKLHTAIQPGDVINVGATWF